MAMKRRMTPAQYIQAGGAQCPFCHAPDVEPIGVRNDLEPEPNTPPKLRRMVKCFSCGEKFWEVYTLTGYEF